MEPDTYREQALTLLTEALLSCEGGYMSYQERREQAAHRAKVVLDHLQKNHHVIVLGESE